jgi:hypothetical protein
MFRPVVSLLLPLILGCATANTFRADNRMNLMRLSPGMAKSEVLDIMGVGKQRICCPIRTVTNPHRSEAYTANGVQFEVLFYYTDKKTLTPDKGVMGDGANNKIEDDELLPIVFQDGKLAGWGWSFWNDAVQRYEIRIR